MLNINNKSQYSQIREVAEETTINNFYNILNMILKCESTEIDLNITYRM